VAGASHESGVKWTKNVFAYRAVVMYDAGTLSFAKSCCHWGFCYFNKLIVAQMPIVIVTQS
jgi:hypothetical protein